LNIVHKQDNLFMFDLSDQIIKEYDNLLIQQKYILELH